MTLPALFAEARRVLFVHAHPDDESLWTGGLIALLTDAGVQVRVVSCTRGERGEVVPGPLAALEGTPALASHRVAELRNALRVLGAGEPCFLGEASASAAELSPRRYTDSGMRWGADGRAIAAEDSGPDAFTSRPEDDAVADLMAAVDAFGAEVLVGYDELGGYGHPDHVRAAAIARRAAAARGIRFIAVPAIENERPGDVRVDISGVLPVKRAALAAHASQLTLTDAGYVLSGGQTRPLPEYELIRG